MGLTVLTIEVGNPADPDRSLPVEFLIDSGAICSAVPQPRPMIIAVEQM